MAKKVNKKKENNEIIIDTTLIDKSNIAITAPDKINDGWLKVDENVSMSTLYVKPKIYNISEISILELIAMEKACALICKRHETAARIDSENSSKFKEYKEYYEKIFSELENRVSNLCNTN